MGSITNKSLPREILVWVKRKRGEDEIEDL
jgi:hypothetical protein